MSKRQFIMILGLLIVVFLFLGFPETLDKIFAVVIGILIVGIAYKMDSSADKSVSAEQTSNVPYVEYHSSPAPSTKDEPVQTRMENVIGETKSVSE